MLKGIGDVKDTLNCNTGEYVQRIGEIVLDGTNTIKFYRTEDRTLKRGEAVFVPDESSGSKLRGTICSIEHHMSFSVPKPVEETPEIIGRA